MVQFCLGRIWDTVAVCAWIWGPQRSLSLTCALLIPDTPRRWAFCPCGSTVWVPRGVAHISRPFSRVLRVQRAYTSSDSRSRSVYPLSSLPGSSWWNSFLRTPAKKDTVLCTTQKSINAVLTKRLVRRFVFWDLIKVVGEITPIINNMVKYDYYLDCRFESLCMIRTQLYINPLCAFKQL